MHQRIRSQVKSLKVLLILEISPEKMTGDVARGKKCRKCRHNEIPKSLVNLNTLVSNGTWMLVPHPLTANVVNFFLAI